MKIFKPKKYKSIKSFKFNKFIFNKNQKQNLIITNFSEFGVETLACTHIIPIIKEVCSNYKIIIVGWSGREYLYRHLADEFWELDESFYYLKDYSNAFANKSKDIKKLESELTKIGPVIGTSFLGNFFVASYCKKCLNFWEKESNVCSKCGNDKINKPILECLNKKEKTDIPIPKDTGIKLPENSVAIFARNRKTYGRNLPKEFYEKLNKILLDNNFTPIYLGENSTSLCMTDCVDFSNKPEAKKLEFTLEVLSKVKFSIQFWTASTRLSSITKTPFIIIESPNQVIYHKQELQRIALTTDYDKKKLVICHYLDFLNNQNQGLNLVEQAINEMKQNNWEHIIGMVKNKELAEQILKQNKLNKW